MCNSINIHEILELTQSGSENEWTKNGVVLFCQVRQFTPFSMEYMSTYLHETLILDAILERQKSEFWEVRKHMSAANLHEI